MYNFLWYLGRISGCHQMPDRSFFLRGKQFPVCARCTGAFIGYVIGGCIFPLLKVNGIICMALCLPMFLDWFVQRIGLLQSNNVRRLITGLMCGFGLIQMYFAALLYIFDQIERLS